MSEQTTIKTTLMSGKEEELTNRLQSKYPEASYEILSPIPSNHPDGITTYAITLTLPAPWSQDMKTFLDGLFADSLINLYEQVERSS